MLSAAAPEHRKETLAIPPDAEAQLEARVARGEVVPLGELQEDYAANPAAREALVSWLKTQGFKIAQVSKDGTSVYARATVDQIERSLKVNMVRDTKDGITYTAAESAPSLPAEVGNAVHAIIGLQPFRQAHKQSRKCVPLRGNRAYLVTSSATAKRGTARKGTVRKSAVRRAGAAAPSPNIQNAPPYLVAEVLKAYNADGLSVTGKGQTIAILIDTFPTGADLKTFWKLNKVATSVKKIEEINVKGGQLPAPEGEESLDVEWAKTTRSGL